MGKTVRVQLHGIGNNRGVLIDAYATEGAIVGSNLRWPDGSIVQESEIRGSTTTTNTTTGSAVHPTLWSLILNVPAIIKSLVALATDGWLRKDGAVLSATHWPYIKGLIESSETVTIPANQQMLLAESFTVEGSLDIEGTLAVL